MSRKIRYIDYLTIIIVLSVFLTLRLTDHKWKPRPGTVATQLSHDSFGYYLYLPSAFIYHDFSKLTYLQDILPIYNPTEDFSQASQGPIDKYVNKYTMGVALFYAPFFLIAHFLVVPYTNYPADGFSAPYQFSIGVGCIFYLIIGLYYLRKSLRFYFSPEITSVTLIGITLGTNLLYYGSSENTISHNQLFCTFSILAYLSLKYHNNPTKERAMLTGIFLGIATLSRPTEAIACLIPLLWGVYNTSSFKNRIQKLNDHKKEILLFIAAFVTILAPQFAYWKLQTGNFTFYTYGNESLNIYTPHLKEVLFSFRKGWLVYTPIMSLALIGIIVSLIKKHQWSWAILAFTMINLYVVSSWDCWWYGGSFSQRAFVQSYAFLSFPLAAVLDAAFKHKSIVIKSISGVLFSALIFLNIMQTIQYRKGIIHYDSMTKKAYFETFGKFILPSNFSALLKEPDYSHYKPQENVRFQELQLINDSFETDYSDHYDKYSSNGIKSYLSNTTTQFSPCYSFTINELPLTPEVRVECNFNILTETPIQYSNIVLSIEKPNGVKYISKTINLKDRNLELNKWNSIGLWIDIPHFVSENDILKAFIFNTGDENIYIDEFRLNLKKKEYL